MRDSNVNAQVPSKPRLPSAFWAHLSEKERLWRLGILGLLAFIAALLVLLPPSPLRDKVLRPCSFHTLCGLPCAMCGGTRAMAAILQGDFSRAWMLNPAAVLLLAATAVFCAGVFAEAAIGRRVCPVVPPRIRTAFAIGLCIVLLAWTPYHAWSAYVARNDELVNFHHPVVRWLMSRGN